jgi:hypothetical protein
LQTRLEEIPANIIIGFFEINFEHHVPFLPLGFFHRVDNLLEDDSIICGSFPWQEATLERANNLVKERAQTVNQDLGDELVDSVA